MKPDLPGRSTLFLACAVLFAGLAAPRAADAQYFGRNKVQYDELDFKVLETEHFDIYYYEEGERIVPHAARMAERWYARLSRLLDHQLDGRQPLILYTSHPHFEQTNAVFGEIGESTGGLTEVLKRRIVLPLSGPLDQSDHVIGHELVHAFQFDITRFSGAGGVGFRGPTALQLPLWFIEGMAEYLSIGPVDPHTAMWMRDAAADCCDLPTTQDLNRPWEFFPYRWGQAFWAFVAGRWGDESVGKVLKVAGQSGNPEGALEIVLQTSIADINREWHESIRAAYADVVTQVLDTTVAAAPAAAPEAGADADPDADAAAEAPADSAAEAASEIRRRQEEARRVLAAQHGAARRLFPEGRETGGLNVGPSLSPDGSRVVFLSEKDLFAIEMFVADVESGQVLRRLTKNASDPHLESLQFINSAGAWSPDGERFAFGSVVKGDAALTIIDPESGRRIRQHTYPGIGEIYSPSFSPDGRRVVFAGLAGGHMDLFVADAQTGELRRLTDDLFSDLQPAWSPDGASIAFVTDRFNTSLETLEYGNYRLALIDPGTAQIQVLPVFGAGKHIDPKWSPDGQSLFFVTDVSGISNLYRYDFRGGDLSRVTNLVTGISGITALSPAISAATERERIVYTAFERGDYVLYVLDEETQLAGVPISGPIEGVTPAMLPPQDRAPGLVTVLRGEPRLGLPDTLTFAGTDYDPSLSLDFVTQPQVGAGVDRFGTVLAGGVGLFFSDMLGNRSLGTLINVNTGAGDITKSSALIVSYENRRKRWNWFVEGGQLPFVTSAFENLVCNSSGTVCEQTERRLWQVNRQVNVGLAYPFNRAQRWEITAGFQNLDFSDERRITLFDLSGPVNQEVIDLDAPKSLNQASASTALVYDNTVFGGTGPILGQRYRFEVSPRFGDLNYLNLLADFRRYFLPVRPITVAARVLHFGRYGSDSEARWSEIDSNAPAAWANRRVLSDLFLGSTSLVRGYNSGSFSADECLFDQAAGLTRCDTFNQLFGSRIAVANFELRIPVLGFFGLIPSPGVPPVEIAPFFDAGVAWDEDFGPELECGSGKISGLNCREVVTSHGIATRVNLLGLLVLEFDYVHPNDRPGQGWYWVFNLIPAF